MREVQYFRLRQGQLEELILKISFHIPVAYRQRKEGNLPDLRLLRKDFRFIVFLIGVLVLRGLVAGKLTEQDFSLVLDSFPAFLHIIIEKRLKKLLRAKAVRQAMVAKELQLLPNAGYPVRKMRKRLRAELVLPVLLQKNRLLVRELIGKSLLVADKNRTEIRVPKHGLLKRRLHRLCLNLFCQMRLPDDHQCLFSMGMGKMP